jgi:two-component system, cell cycle response regulator DivK
MQIGNSGIESWSFTMMISQQSSGRNGRVTAKPLVLAVDDNDDNLVLLSCALELLDCEFVGKASAQAALNFVQERPPDLVLLDVMMPDMHGVDLMHLLKQDVRIRQVPIIAITGMVTPESRTDLLEAGFSDYMAKPYMVDELEAMVRYHLSQTGPASYSQLIA